MGSGALILALLANSRAHLAPGVYSKTRSPEKRTESRFCTEIVTPCLPESVDLGARGSLP